MLIDFGPLFLPTWHFFYFLAAMAALLMLPGAFLRFGAEDIPPSVRSHLYMLGYLGGYFGARLLGILTEEPETKGVDLLSSLFQFGPMTFYGGFLGCALMQMGYCLARKINPGKVADPLVFCGFLALGLGRLGCFFNGDDYGIEVSQIPTPFWAVTFPSHPQPIPRVPVQLMESFLAFLIAGITWAFAGKFRRTNGKHRGRASCLMVASYAVGRFFLEFLRGDARGYVLLPWLSTSQFISFLVLLTSVSLLIWPFSRPDKTS